MSLNPLITNVNPTQSLYAAFGAGANLSQLTVSSIVVAAPNGSPDSGLILFENAAPSTTGGVVFYKDAANQEPVLIGPAIGQGVIGVQSATSSVFETLAVGELQIWGPASSTFSNAVRLIGDPSGFLTISSSVYTHLLEADAVSTSVLDIDGQALTATPTELLLNGIPLATTSNLSSVADWALDPAVSTVQMNGNNLIGANVGSFSTLLADSGVFRDLSTTTLTAFSTIHVISSISSVVEEAQLGIFSTLFVTSFISTPDIEVSSINGAVFGSSSITVEVLGVSSLVATSISSLTGGIREALVSTLQLNVNPSFNPSFSGSVDLGLGSLFGNLGGAAAGVLGVVVGGAALGTGIAALTQTRQTNNINSNAYELVNGTTQLQISTLGTAFSTVYRFVSSVSENVPGQEVFVSTIHGPGVAIRSVSDPLNTVSSPLSTIQSFGQWVALDANLPIPSTISSFQELFTSSFATSTINFNNGTQFRPGVPFGGTGFVSTTELYWSDASPPLDADLRVGALVISGSDVGGLNYSKDVLIQNQNSGNRLSVFPGQSTIAYLEDIPGVTSTFLNLTTTNLDVSTISFPSVPGCGMSGDDALTIIQGIFSITAKNTEFSTIQGEGGGNLQITTPATAPSLRASTINLSTAVLEGQLIINASTLRSGIYMPFDPVNGTGVVAVGLSTGNVFNQYSAFLAAQVDPIGGAPTTEVFTILETKDAEVSFQYADLQLGRVLVTGPLNYGSYTTGFLTGDGAGNIAIVANTTSISSLVTSTIASGLITTDRLSTGVIGIGAVNLSTSTAAGSASQPAGRLVIGGNDVDLGQNDLWCQQVRVGAGNPGGSAQTEVIWYSPDGVTQRGIGLGGSDLTLRIQSTINSGTNNGYILDTLINKPFFSTINGATNLMATLPSTTLGVLGVSTLSVLPPLNYFASVYSSTSQTVAGANTATNATWNTTSINTGGFTVGVSTVAVPVAGTYMIDASFQFATTSGGTNKAQFWIVKNGTAIPQTNSIVSIVNNGDTLGNISVMDVAAAGDKYGWVFYSSDANMTASATAAGATPAVPSLIVNCRRLG